MKPHELDKYIISYKNGCSEDFDIIYYETEKTVYLSIYAIIKDKNLIEDIMQDTYLKAINSLDSYILGTNFKAWIARIARNNAINTYNVRKRENIVDPVDSSYIVDAIDQNESPLLNKALSILQGEEKDIIIYHIVLNFGFKIIAQILNIPQSTVFAKYKNAIVKIKKEV